MTATPENAAISNDLEAMLAKLQLAEEAETQTAVAIVQAAPDLDDEATLLGQLDLIIAPPAPAEAAPAAAAPAKPAKKPAKAKPAPVTASTELSADELAALQIAEVQAEVYQQADAGIAPETAVAPAEKPAKPAKAPKEAKAPKAAAPKRERDLKALPDHVFQRWTNEGNAQAKADVLANPPKQVKIVEKWDNLFVSLHAGVKPSKFTVTGFHLLKVKGTMTTTDLVSVMRAEGLSEGTARSQTGQIMALFALVGIAHRAGQTLTLRTDSVIAHKLTTILGL